jgi:superoxide reductase
MKVVKIYKCDVCGNMVLKLKDGQGNMMCCNKPMTLLEPNTSDGASEKHVPYIKSKIKDCKIANNAIYEVQIGSIEHPMSIEHHIE